LAGVLGRAIEMLTRLFEEELCKRRNLRYLLPYEMVGLY